mmetsp:Transcript_31400/g.79346  ORF Transcript_31400/g.79346 Transcript_31400/m.79346 type:complete len:229 (+) Transcript_31400:2348-3034(+)
MSWVVQNASRSSKGMLVMLQLDFSASSDKAFTCASVKRFRFPGMLPVPSSAAGTSLPSLAAGLSLRSGTGAVPLPSSAMGFPLPSASAGFPLPSPSARLLLPSAAVGLTKLTVCTRSCTAGLPPYLSQTLGLWTGRERPGCSLSLMAAPRSMAQAPAIRTDARQQSAISPPSSALPASEIPVPCAAVSLKPGCWNSSARRPECCMRSSMTRPGVWCDRRLPLLSYRSS